MSEIIPCPVCERKLRLPDQHRGQEVRCPSCAATFLPAPPLPASSGPSRPPAAPSEEAPAPRPRLARPRSWSEEALPSRSGSKVFLVLGVLAGLGALLLMGAIVVAWALWPSSQPRRMATPEDAELRRQEVKEAFHDEKPLPPGEIGEELRGLFEELGAAFRARDRELLLRHFDVERMFDELSALDVFPPAVLRDKRNAVRSMRTGLGQSMHQQATLLSYERFEVRNVKKLPGNESVVIVRHHTAEGVTLKMRWWVVRRPSGWKIYDLEDLDIGMRFSTTAGAITGMGLDKVREIARGTTGIREALVALVEGDPDKADRKLKGVAGVKLPRKLEAVRWLATGMLHLHRGQFKESLESLDRAHRFHPDMPLLNLLKGAAFNGLGKGKEALEHLESYRDLLGEDAEVCRHIGEALRWLRRFPEAAASYRKALDHNPKHADAFLGLLLALAAHDKRDDVPGRFAKLDQPHENFLTCAESCQENQDGEGLEQIALAMRKIDPRYAPVDYNLCLVRAWAGRADEAVSLFKSALAREADAEKRKDYHWGFLQAMTKAGKALEAYAAAPLPPDAFRYLAGELKESHHMEELRKLVRAHEKKHPEERLLPFYRGEVHVWEGNYPLAEKAFAAGLARPPDRELELFRSSRVLAQYHTGHAFAAYAKIEPRQETFAQLASLLFGDRKDPLLHRLLDAHERASPGNADVLRYRYRLAIRQGRPAQGAKLFKAALAKQKQPEQRKRMVAEFLSDMTEAGQLEALIAAHRLAEPDDWTVPAWELEARWLEKDYAGALKLLTEHRAGLFASPRFSWKRDNYLVRCLVKLKKTEESVREVESQARKKRGGPLLRALAHAAHGDVKQTADVLSKMRPEAYARERCYADEDLGPILRSEAFREFREKWPEPKKKAEGER